LLNMHNTSCPLQDFGLAGLTETLESLFSNLIMHMSNKMIKLNSTCKAKKRDEEGIGNACWLRISFHSIVHRAATNFLCAR